MTVVELSPNGHGSVLSVPEKRARARADLRADPTLEGAEVGRRYGMTEDWGRKQMRAVRAEPGVLPVARPAPDRTTSEQPKRTRALPAPGEPWLLRAGQYAGFVLVAAVCAVLSYTHVKDLAVLVGLDNAAWIPLGIDGLVVVTTCSLMIDKRAGRRSPVAARLGFWIGILGTLTANAIAVNSEFDLDPWSIVRMALAVYPPITLAVVLHLVFLRHGGQR